MADVQGFLAAEKLVSTKFSQILPNAKSDLERVTFFGLLLLTGLSSCISLEMMSAAVLQVQNTHMHKQHWLPASSPSRLWIISSNMVKKMRKTQLSSVVLKWPTATQTHAGMHTRVIASPCGRTQGVWTCEKEKETESAREGRPTAWQKGSWLCILMHRSRPSSHCTLKKKEKTH